MNRLMVDKEKKLSSQAIQLLVNHGIFQFGNALSLIFVNLYLWRLTNSLFVNGLYNLIAILSQATTTFSIGKVAKKKGKLTIYRYGIFLTAFFYLCIVIMRENMIDHFYWFAVLQGIGQALYWLGYFTIVHEVSTNHNRHRYLGWNQIVMGMSNLIGPAIAGLIISLSNGLTGYTIVFSLAFVMFFIATIGSFRLKKEESHRRAYYMKYLGLMIRRKPNFMQAMIGWFIIGFPQGILMYIPPILLYTIFNDESIVGYLNIIFLGLSIISSYIISRFAIIHSTRKYLFIAAIGFILSAMTLIWDINVWTVLLFMAINHSFKPLQANAYAAYYFKWIDLLPLKQEFRVESVVLREAIINLGEEWELSPL